MESDALRERLERGRSRIRRSGGESDTERERERERWGVGVNDQYCISSLCSGRLNQQCQVFFLEAAWRSSC